MDKDESDRLLFDKPDKVSPTQLLYALTGVMMLFSCCGVFWLLAGGL